MNRHVALAAFSLVTALAVLAPGPRPTLRQEGARSSEVAAAAHDARWWSAVQARLAAEEYEVSQGEGVLQAPNRAHGFRTSFTPEGVSIAPRMQPESWQWSWRTMAMGRGEALAETRRVPPRANGARVEYDRGGVVEWYENSPQGLEQGFTVTARPRGSGSVRIRGLVGDPRGRLRPRHETGALVCSLPGGADVLRYDALHVVDATGRELPSRMISGGTTVELAYDDENARYPVTVDPLVTSPAWTRPGSAAGDVLGYAVATAGDVNNDGLSDILVAAPGYENAAGEPLGRVFLFIGRATGPAVVADWYATPSGCDGAGRFGHSVAGIGDVNGDGYDDIAIGAPLVGEPNLDSEGMVFVWEGGPPGVNGVSGLGPNGTRTNADWVGTSDRTQSNFGQSVAGAGDVNGDGFADLLVGAPGYRDQGAQLDEGWSFVWLGGPGGAGGLGESGTPENADWSAQSDFAGAAFGWSVATAGDVNADGYDDVLIGAPGANGAFLWLGGAADLGANGIPFNADWSANGTQAGARLGTSVCTAGDVDGDGYADVAIGAPRYDDPEDAQGKVFVWLGGPADLGANGNPVNADWSAAGSLADAEFGRCVAPAGDFDGDGFADLLVGAPGLSNALHFEGSVWAYRGSGAGLESAASWSLEGNLADIEFGHCVATAGDVNGDGFADVLVGAPLRDGAGVDAGWVGLYTGSARGPETTASWFQESNQADGHFGTCVASAGDVNGDGYSDVLVGAPDFDGGQADEGRVYLYPGLPTGLALNASWRAEGNQIDARFGFSVSTAGDLNGDGYADIVIGAPRYDTPGGAEAGAFFVWFGAAAWPGPNGTPTNADRGILEMQPGAEFGHCVAWLGDVNGDGFSDIGAGAPFHDSPALGEGLVLAFYGGLDGIDAARSWRQEGGQGGCNLGASLAGAGDVNGDGLSDVIIGAPGFDAPEEDEGRAGVMLGNAAGLPHSFIWYDEPDQVGAQFGRSVAGAGDVNGDGYSDVLVGAPHWESIAGQLSEGRVALYMGSPIGPGDAPDWTAEANLPGARLGTSVATGGDVNGDGYSEALVGAPGVAISRGSAYLWLGGAAGLGAAGTPANADWTDDGDLGVVAGQYGTCVASAGDVDGDGFSDLIVGAPYADGDLLREGRAFVYYGNSSHGQDRAAQQWRHDGAGPVHALGFSSSESQFGLRALGRSAGGRARVRLECETRRGPFAWSPGAVRVVTGWHDSGAPGARGSVVSLQGVLSLSSPGLYKWRSRVATRSPLFPHGPWLRLPDNAQGEGDILLTNGVLAAEPRRPAGAGLRLLGPQPSRGAVRLAFELAERSAVSLEVFDAAGRRVRTLVHGQSLAPGAHELEWDGRATSGASVAPGCYFARLAHGSARAGVRIVRVN